MHRQQSFLSEQKNEFFEKTSWTVFIDGASRGNPGQAGAGIYVTTAGETIAKQGFFLATKTNNQAEYLALVLALLLIKKISSEQKISPSLLTIISDSELLIKQMKGIYSVKNSALLSMKTVAVNLLQETPHRFMHVLREKNTVADELANNGIDKKIKIPHDFLIFLSKHNILV
ncbi:MAG: ribonuclease HI family protein [Candidatus Babeliales bacterium]|jgi:ribonuclease HI